MNGFRRSFAGSPWGCNDSLNFYLVSQETPRTIAVGEYTLCSVESLSPDAMAREVF